MSRNNIPSWEKVLAIKGEYIPGTQIMLDAPLDNGRFPGPAVGDVGTVDFVDDLGQIHMKWKDANGDLISTLALIQGVDSFHITVAGPQFRRICVTRSGYATVQASSDEEALNAAQELVSSDFDWEEMQDILPDAEVIETCDERGTLIGIPDGAHVEGAASSQKERALVLAGNYLMLPMGAYGAYLEGSEGEDNPMMYFAVAKEDISRYLDCTAEDEKVERWLKTFTDVDARLLYDFANLDCASDAVPFVWVPYAEEPLEILCIESHGSALALIDFLSKKLQENGHGKASDYLRNLLS